jgi:serine/threonine-protein kinase
MDQPTVISTRSPMAVPVQSPASPSHLGRTLVGQRLDHFELQEFVGGGGMGAVFRALDTRLNRIVALKVLAREQADEEDKVRRFQNEAQSAARLDHEHIARVYYVGQDCGLHYIVFEYIEGTNLRDLVDRRGPLPLEEAISYAVQVAMALDHASSRDVVHRDIKPSNVLITPQGKAKLVDMGLARLHQVEHTGQDLTSSGVTLGTFDYISPEQARDPRAADVRSDIYSLGCTLFYMLTARPPFPDGNVLQKLLQHNSDPPPDPADFSTELPEAVSRVVRKMLAKDPRRRHQTPGELAAELLAIADQLGLRLSLPDSAAWSPAPQTRISRLEQHLPWLAPLAALVVIVLALDYFWAEPEPNGPSARNASAARQGVRNSRVRLPANGQAAPVRPRPITENDASAAASEIRDATSSAQDISPRSNPETTGPFRQDSPPTEQPVAEPSPAATASANGPGQPTIADSAASRTSVPTATPGSQPEPGTGTAPGTAASPQDVDTASTAPTLPMPMPMSVGNSELRTPLIVNPASPQAYATLAAACAAARNDDIIDLQFNGRHVERAIRLNNLKLTIRAAAGYRPVLVFQPKEPSVQDRAMFTVIGGSLSLLGVALELDVPRYLGDWSLFETQRPDLLDLRRCWLTIRNAAADRSSFQTNVAFFEIKAPPGAGAMTMETTPAAEPLPLRLKLTDCVARGEAVFLRAAESQPVALDWRNGLLATSERLLVHDGGETAPRGRIAVYLDHVTAFTRNGLGLIRNIDAPHLMGADFECENTILVAAADSPAPLVEQTGVSTVGDFEDLLTWNGRHCYYSGYQTFWSISNQQSEPVKRTLAQWQEHWNEDVASSPFWSQVVWRRLPDASRPVHTHTVTDYLLDENAPNNSPVRGAIDTYDAGAILSLLPPEPVESGAPGFP